MSDSHRDQTVSLPQRPVREVRRYARLRYLLFGTHLVAGVAFLALMIAGGSASITAAALEIAGARSYYLTLFYYFAGFSLAHLAFTLPLKFYREYVLEHQFGLSNQTLGQWVGRRMKKWGIFFVLATPVVLVFYAMLRHWPTLWWLPAAGVWMLFSYVLAKFAPRILIPLFYRLEPIANDKLKASLGHLASKAGIELTGVCRIDLSRETKKANAAVVGMGKTRRVVLGDTLLEKFTPEEIAAVFAHELGHIVRRHLLKGFLLAALLATVSLYAGSRVLLHATRALGIRPIPAEPGNPVASPETVPILVAVLAAIQLLVLPLEKWYSRRREVESDASALCATGDRAAFVSAMAKLGWMNLADVKPNKLAEVFLFSHPPISKRIRFAQEFNLGSER